MADSKKPKVNKKKTYFYIVLAFAVTMVFWFFIRYRADVGKIILPIIYAMVIAYLMRPLVRRLENKGIKRATGIIMVYLLFILGLLAVTVFILPELINNTRELIRTVPEITVNSQKLFDKAMSMIRYSDWPADVKNAILGEIEKGTYKVENFALDALRSTLTKLIEIITMFFDIVLAMFIAYYLMKDAEQFRESVLSITPRSWRNWLTGTGREISSIMSGFIQGQLLTALIVGILEVIGLYIAGVKYPLILGLIGGIANIIPYFGPFIGAIPAVAVALIDSPVRAVWATVVFIIIQQLDNAFISPKIIEGKLGLHPVTTIMVVLIGGQFFGILGMLVAVPIAAILKVILKKSVDAIA